MKLTWIAMLHTFPNQQRIRHPRCIGLHSLVQPIRQFTSFHSHAPFARLFSISFLRGWTNACLYTPIGTFFFSRRSLSYFVHPVPKIMAHTCQLPPEGYPGNRNRKTNARLRVLASSFVDFSRIRVQKMRILD